MSYSVIEFNKGCIGPNEGYLSTYNMSDIALQR